MFKAMDVNFHEVHKHHQWRDSYVEAHLSPGQIADLPDRTETFVNPAGELLTLAFDPVQASRVTHAFLGKEQVTVDSALIALQHGPAPLAYTAHQLAQFTLDVSRVELLTGRSAGFMPVEIVRETIGNVLLFLAETLDLGDRDPGQLLTEAADAVHALPLR